MHNRPTNKPRSAQSKLAEALHRRKSHLSSLQEYKSNEFVDRRIGESRLEKEGLLSKEDALLKRIVKERVRRSNKRRIFSLEDNDGGGTGELTHGVSYFAAAARCALLA